MSAHLILLAGCGAAKETTAPSAPVASVTVSPAASTIPVGGSVQLIATTKDTAGNVLSGRTVTWTTSNGALATVSSPGVVTGVAGGGPVTITATSEGQNGTATVTVSPVPVASVTVSPAAATVLHGVTLQLTATTLDSAGNALTGRVITWGSNNEAVATVSASGLVTGMAQGSATITATSEGKSGTSATTTVTLVFSVLSTGSEHTCGLVAGGAAYCWGFNYYGELGNGTTSSAPELATPLPGAVSGAVNFAALSPGYFATCGIATSGATYCWGLNITGLFGDGTLNNSTTPVPAASGLALAALSQGDQHACGLAAGGIPYCWGWNRYGELGNGSTTDSWIPVAVPGGLIFTAIKTSGPADVTCGITADGLAYCWGPNGYGQVGAATSGTCSGSPCALAPVAVGEGLSFVAVSPSSMHTCAVATGGAAYCWGDNSVGELGVGDSTSRQKPATVVGRLTFTTVTTGVASSCGLAVSGAVYCWGANDHGQLGDGTFTSRPTPVKVVGGISFVALTSGARHSCGISSAGTSYCWGANAHGELGNGSTTDSSTPARVAGQP